MDDLEGMQDPERWPLWPLLPLKHITRRDEIGFPVLGFILDPILDNESFPAWTVFEGDFILATRERGLTNAPKHHFKSAEEIVAAGWRVD